MKQNNELAGIEVLRFLCAFSVVVWHYQHFFFIGGWDPVASQGLRPYFPLYRVLSFFYNNGSLAVEFFWVISGFIFYWHYSEQIRNRTVTFPDFLVRRFARLYPLHFVTLIFVAVGQYVYFKSHQTTFIYLWNKPIWFASQLLLASNWLTHQPESFNAPIWSVSIEILIYLSFFAIARVFGPRALVAACVAAIFSVCFNLIHSFINPNVFACGMYFFAGGVAQRLSTRAAALPVAGCAAVAVSAALTFGVFDVNAAWILLLATCAVIVVTRLGETRLAVPFQSIAFLGNATYSSYLLHFPLQLVMVTIIDAMGYQRSIFYHASMLLIFLFLVGGLSLLVHRHFEMPAQEFIKRRSKFFLQKVA